MGSVAFLREMAERCRELLNLSAAPEIIEQLTEWVEEFEEEAKRLERSGQVR